MFKSLTQDDFLALLMFHTSRFRYLWESGVVTTHDPEEGYLVDIMKEHAAFMFILYWAVTKEKKFGFIRKGLTKKLIKRVEQPLTHAGLLREVLQLAEEIAMDVIEGEEIDLERIFKRRAKIIISISPNISLKLIERLDEDDIIDQGLRMGLSMNLVPT